MNDDSCPKFSARGHAEAARRQQRQAEALRANLARRKAQGRARAEGEAEAAPGGEPCSASGPGVQDSET
ncbi:hypothetical protein CCC_02975 [Paramagnetospirillum magnetotacticum MS-1]|uniref:Uncharacterized protein n=1 Tax=Paramagnetospirillum magnetotacticum MS-1 TaxID=272627 RepID=A0A0C2V553_PARME|nr:hypothetical protein [Paramagnetospirillum magnetotacticum]KIM00187.1 hypothetical protein CCC_02975 [Paramagnetospirillum magnetotacticum MS-1]